MEVPNVTGNYQDSDESRRASEGGESIDDSSRTTEAWIHVPFVGSVKVKDTQKKTEKNETKEPEAQKSAADSKAEQPRAETTEPALSPEPAPEEPEDVTQPEPSFDPNTTTDAKVINSYPLTSKEKNTLGIQQRGAYNLYAKKKYKDALAAFAKLTDDYPEINYLSAYWAGMTSLKIKNGRAEALEWFNRALEINPDYKPAATEKMKLEKRK
jgi:TolA-binding protein